MEQSRPDQMKLYELAKGVSSKETFLVFLEALRRDLEAAKEEEAEQQSNPYGPHGREWENITLENFLEAMHAWTEDMRNRIDPEPSWRTFAQMLIAARGYE